MAAAAAGRVEGGGHGGLGLGVDAGGPQLLSEEERLRQERLKQL